MRTVKLGWVVGAAGVAIGGAAIYIAFSRIDLAQLQTDLTGARYGFVLLSGLVLVSGLLVRALRWRALLDRELNLPDSFGILCIGYLLNSLLPMRAGELARVILATRARPPVPALKTTSTIVLERILDLLAILVVLALTLSAAPLPAEIRAAATAAVPTAIAGFLLLVFLANQRTLAEKLLAWAAAHIPLLRRFDISQWTLHFLDGLKPLTQPTRLLVVLVWTALAWGFTIGAGYVLMFAFYDQASWLTACLFIGVLAFVVALPAIPGNIGTYELAIMISLQATGYGEPANIALVFAVLLHTVDVAVYVVTGLAGFVQQGISFMQLSRQIQSARH